MSLIESSGLLRIFEQTEARDGFDAIEPRTPMPFAWDINTSGIAISALMS
jgi:hypothetical protein